MEGELRVKIQKLKYKLTKEQNINGELKLKMEQLRRLSFSELSLERVLKHISLQLRQKGMCLEDWLLSLPYSSEGNLQCLLQILKTLSIKIERSEADLLLNFSGEDLSQRLSYMDFESLASSCHLNMSD